jgi:hypothetical protein
MKGWIYFVQKDGRIKIGFSSDPYRRIKRFGPQSVLLGLTEGDTSKERKFHRKFKRHKISGEWFEDHQQIREFAARCNSPLPKPKERLISVYVQERVYRFVETEAKKDRRSMSQIVALWLEAMLARAEN